MALEVIDGAVNARDGIAGAEVGRLEAWAVNYLQQYGKSFFKTIERWRGQIDANETTRLGFKVPALFVTCLGTSGSIDSSGAAPIVKVRFDAAGITANGTGADLGEEKGRYHYGVSMMGIVLSLVNQMVPPKVLDSSFSPARRVDDPRYPWRRANEIGASNKYSAKLDRMGFSLFEIQWSHDVQIGNINLNLLPDLNTIFGDIHPDGGTPPALGEVIFT